MADKEAPSGFVPGKADATAEKSSPPSLAGSSEQTLRSGGPASPRRSHEGTRIRRAEKDSLLLAEERREDERRKAHNKRRERAISRLMDSDRALADLLMQTAGSLSALVTITSDGEKAVAAGSDNAEHQAQAARDSLPSTASSADRVKVFEGRASQWFATLNDIQTSLRTATATLRADGRPAISDGVNLFGQGSSYAARTEAGSAGRGHTLPLQGAMSGHGPRKEDRDASLSLGALRLQQQSWRQLNDALEEIATGSAHLEPDQHHIARNRSSTSEERTRDVTSSVREHQLTADARLIGALLGSTSTLGSHQNPGEKHQPASGSSSTALA